MLVVFGLGDPVREPPESLTRGSRFDALDQFLDAACPRAGEPCGQQTEVAMQGTRCRDRHAVHRGSVTELEQSPEVHAQRRTTASAAGLPLSRAHDREQRIATAVR